MWPDILRTQMAKDQQGPPRKPKSQQKPPSLLDEYRELVRTPAAVLLADGTLVLLALFIMAIVFVVLRGFLVLGISAKFVEFVEMADTYSMGIVILIFCIDTPIKIGAFAASKHKT
jgi:hypothetical protein